MSDYEAWWLKAMGENRELRTDLERVRQQRDVVIEHEHVMTTEIEGLRERLDAETDEAAEQAEAWGREVEHLRGELQYVIDCDDGPGGRDAIEMMRIRAAVDGRPWPPSDVAPLPAEGATNSIWPPRGERTGHERQRRR